jgi:hypothetical protein
MSSEKENRRREIYIEKKEVEVGRERENIKE